MNAIYEKQMISHVWFTTTIISCLASKFECKGTGMQWIEFKKINSFSAIVIIYHMKQINTAINQLII